jgi:phosphoribosylamine-glycine ligase
VAEAESLVFHAGTRSKLCSNDGRKSEAESLVFHAGTRRTDDGRLLTDGGRVLAVTGLGDTLPAAIARAYTGIERIHFQGMHFRRDIGARALVSAL